MVSTQLSPHLYNQYVHRLRTFHLLTPSLVLIIFSILCAGAYGANGNLQGMFAALAAYRFLIGIGIGGE